MSFDISEGEIIGLIGESGSGKTTIGRLLVRLEEPDSGGIYMNGTDISHLSGKALKLFYRNVQMIFQDPYESNNPRFTVFETVVEPVKIQHLVSGGERIDRVSFALERAGLNPPRNFFSKFPHELSGGERQRLSIARALVMQPRVLIADEPVSMLDVSIKAGILNLLKSLSKDNEMAILYISHDLSTVKYLCDRMIVMYMGKFVEIGFSENVIDQPKHPYTKALKSAIPLPDPSVKRDRILLETSTEKSFQDIEGCCYSPECQWRMKICAEQKPELKGIDGDHYVACHLY